MNMRTIGLMSVAISVALTGAARGTSLVNFDDAKAGTVPAGWMEGVTGKGKPVWAVRRDETAPSKPNVLAQNGAGTFPFCVLKDVSIADGFVGTKFKPISGKEDQAGGLIWRFKDKDNYYISRANALEDNVTIYHTIKGSRQAFKNVDIKVASGVWHTLRVEFKGSHFTVLFDGKRVLEADDTKIQGPGAVGLWTKADSVTYFDDCSYGPLGS